MNDYRISFRDGEDTSWQRIIERTEAAARRAFKATHKDVEITGIEVVAENVSATKAQEREALETIRQLIADMGPHSYIGTAFAGCLEDAENNIDDDAAYSMKGRLETAEEKLRQEIAEHQATRRELEKTMQALRDVESNVQYLSEAAAEAKARAIPLSLWKSLYGMVKARRDNMTFSMEQEAERMAANADNPGGSTFVNAVKAYKEYRETRQRAEALMGQLEGIAPDGAEF